MKRLEGKVAIVTGGGRGIGAGIARRFAEEGCAVSVIDQDLEGARKTAEELRGLGVKTLAAQCEVSNFAEAEAMVRRVLEELGGLDILVNNAGIIRESPVEDAELEAFQAVMAVNYFGTLNCSKAAIPQFRKQMSGRIINCSSISGKLPDVHQGVYGASKAAVENLTRVLAGELGIYNVTVNAYAPGLVKTPMTAGILAMPPIHDILMDRMCIRRFGDPRDIGNLCVFLASDEAGYITGATIPVDGGMMCVQAPWRMSKDSTTSRELDAKLANT